LRHQRPSAPCGRRRRPRRRLEPGGRRPARQRPALPARACSEPRTTDRRLHFAGEMGLPPVNELGALDENSLAEIRSRFRELGFLPEVLAAAESVAPGQLDAVALPLVRSVLRQRGDPGAWLARLFTYGEALPGVAAREHLGPGPVAALLRSGLLVESGNFVRC